MLDPELSAMSFTWALSGWPFRPKPTCLCLSHTALSCSLGPMFPGVLADLPEVKLASCRLVSVTLSLQLLLTALGQLSWTSQIRTVLLGGHCSFFGSIYCKWLLICRYIYISIVVMHSIHPAKCLILNVYMCINPRNHHPDQHPSLINVSLS